jgi:hypothetical protein
MTSVVFFILALTGGGGGRCELAVRWAVFALRMMEEASEGKNGGC